MAKRGIVRTDAVFFIFNKSPFQEKLPRTGNPKSLTFFLGIDRAVTGNPHRWADYTGFSGKARCFPH
jgi:hypothetical protein